MEGFLWKKGKRFGSYKKRFFAIAGLSISYRESFEPGSKGKGVIDLAKVKYFSSCSDPTKHRKVGWFSSFALDLVTDTRTWTLIPESEADRNLWVDALLKILPQQVISSELRDSSLARARAAAAAAVPVVSPRGGGESDDGGRVQKSPKKPKKMSSSESEEDVVVKPKVNAKANHFLISVVLPCVWCAVGNVCLLVFAGSRS